MLLVWNQLPSTLLVLLFACVILQQPLGGSVTAKKMKDIFRDLNLGIYCQRNPKYGEETNVIATVKELPKDVIFLTRIYSSSNFNFTSHMILRFMTPIQYGAHWSKTSNLSEEFDKLQINDKVPFRVGYYVSASPIFYQYGDVNLDLEVIQKTVKAADVTGRRITITIKPPLDCMPRLNMFECENALSPMNIEASEYLHLNAILKYNCSKSSVGDRRYKWTVYDMLGQNLLINLGETSLPELGVSAFQLSFNFAENAIRHRLLLEVETLFKNTKIVARCYIHIKHGEIKAKITGGNRRYVNVKKQILMDGSKSQDEAGGQNSDLLIFQWSCTTKHQQQQQKYCRADMSSEVSFSIPQYKLKLNYEYMYTLTVISKDNKDEKSVAKQTVIVVERDVVSLEIVCVANCRFNYYCSHREVVLKGVCNDCDDEKLIHYEWFLDDMTVEQKQTLKTKISVENRKVHVKLSIETVDGRVGTDFLILYENNGPNGGDCVIEPTLGQEINTNFFVKCHGWVTEKWPLRYYIITQKVTLTACKSSHCEVQLPTTKLVVVRVCDSVMICYEVQLPVDVRPWLKVPQGPDGIKTLLDSSHLNIIELIKTGNEDKAHLILNAIATQIKTSSQGEALLDVFKNHVPNNVFELGKMGNLTRTLFDSFGRISNDELRVITNVTKILNDNFQDIIDKGMSHHLGYEPFQNITVSLMSVLRNLENMTMTMPKPPEYFLKLIKGKPYTEESMEQLREEIAAMPIKEARDRTSIWLESSYQLDRLNKFLSDANAWHVNPDEDLRPTAFDGISIQHICLTVTDESERILQTADHIHIVHFTTKLLGELSEYLKSDRICLKVFSHKRNLGWWYPQERQPSKILLGVSVYSKSAVMHRLTELRNGLIYFVYLGKYKPALRHRLDDIMRALNRDKGLWADDNGTFDLHNDRNDADDYDDDDDALWLMEPFMNLVDLSSTSYNSNSDHDDYEDSDNDSDNDNQGEYADEDDYEEDDNMMTIDDIDRDSEGEDITNKGDTNMDMDMDMDMDIDMDMHMNNDNSRGRRRKRVVDDDSDRASSYGTYVNALMNDTIDLYEEIHHYHVPLDGKSVLAVRFLNSSHDLSIYVSLNFAPKRRQTSRSRCYVRAGEHNRTILLGNTCMKKGFAFVAVRVLTKGKVIMCDINKKVVDGPAKFSFVLQIRACDYWHAENNDEDDDESEWRMYGCMPAMTYNIARGMTCVCQYISTYTAYVFNLPGRKIRSPPCIRELPIRAEVVIFFVLVYIILFVLLFASIYCIKEEITSYCDIRVNEQNADQDLHRIIVVIRTGGHTNATTTANITITFQTFNYEELSFTLYQDPNSPVLISNTAYIVKFESRDIRLPTRLGISHDNAGRYPSWNIEYIEVLDKTTNQYQHFHVQDWIRDGQMIVLTAPMMHNLGNPYKQKWTQLFRSSLERNFVNWFGIQPLVGVWRPSFNTRPMTRFERICIWVAKFIIAMTISFLYYGRTTIDNFEEEYETFQFSSVYVPFGDTIWISVICCLVTNIVQYVYEFVLLPIQDCIKR